MNQVYLVTDFGAKGDGVTDDTAAIQRALDAAETAGGGVVVIPEGTFIVSGDGRAASGTLRVGSKVSLTGAGMGETIIKLADGSSGDVTGIIRTVSGEISHDISISNLTIDGNRANTSGLVDGIFTGVTPGVAAADHDILIRSVEIKNVSRYAFDPHEQTVRLTIVDSYAHDNGKDGFTLDYISQSVLVDNLSADNGRHGFNVVTSSHDNLLVDNIAHGNLGDGLITQNGSELRAWTSDIMVVGGEYYDNALQGVLVKLSENVTVYGADVHGNGREGISVAGSVNVSLIANSVHDNSQSGPGDYDEVRISDLTSGDYVELTGKTWSTSGVTISSDAAVGWVESASPVGPAMFLGGGGDDRLGEAAGNDYVDGGEGVDTLAYAGSLDQFELIFTHTGKLIVFDMTDEESGSGIDVLERVEILEFAGQRYTIEELRERELSRGYVGYDLAGTTASDRLVGGVTDDRLDGRAGADALVGGLGDDVYIVDDAKDLVLETVDGGFDSVAAQVSARLAANVENLTLTGAAFGGYGNETDNTIAGNDAANELKGYGGDDRLIGGGGADLLYGGGGRDQLSGDDGDDCIGAGDGDDTVVGGAGADTMKGGFGDDIFYVDDTGDVVYEFSGQGLDRVIATIDYVLAEKVEDLELAGSALRGTGNRLANHLIGNDLANHLDGGAGSDVLAGGKGDDVYFVDQTGDVVVEASSAGTDTVISSVGHWLAGNVENLTLSGGANIDAIGNALANTIIGNGGANVLDGAAGSDALEGGKGDDVYLVDNKYDTVFERAGEGIDTVRSSVDFTLAANVEDLVLQGNAVKGTGNELDNRIAGTDHADTLYGLAGQDRLIGLDGNDKLVGGDGADELDGGSGGDTMSGANGDDTYVVDSTGDVVVEFNNGGAGGYDTVYSSIAWTLADNFERLVLTGAEAVAAIGNTSANRIAGNSGDNTIDGGSGNDVLSGGDGADTFVFSGSFGVDVVADFDVARDRLDFRDAAVPVDLVTAMQQVGADVVISLAASLSVTLQSVDLADLQRRADVFV